MRPVVSCRGTSLSSARRDSIPVFSFFPFFARLFGFGKPLVEPTKSSPEDAMKSLRLMALQMSPAEFDFKPSRELPHVFGVLMDWPVDKAVVSVVSFRDGTTSLYTTGTFGILGGGFHESVQMASREFLICGEACYEDALPSKDFSYPSPDRMRFYLMCYDGLRMLEDTQDAFRRGRNPRAVLAAAAQDVVSALRAIHEGSGSGG